MLRQEALDGSHKHSDKCNMDRASTRCINKIWLNQLSLWYKPRTNIAW